MTFQLIYTGALASSMSGEELASIAKTSRAKNLSRGITGVLLCKDESVLQVLEGEKAAVLDLYETIKADPRVTNTLVLIQRNAAKREFPNWSMGFKNADNSDAAFKLCARSFPDALPANASPEVNTIGRTFARVNGLT